MKAIIVDDEQHNVNNLHKLLEKYCPDVDVIGSASNVDDAISLIRQKNPDILFLDIHMPDKNGFEMLQELNRYDFEVVFVTAYSDYGIRAIKFSAIDYLVKPINIEELKFAVVKATEKIRLKKANERLENLLEFVSNHNSLNNRIAISSLKET